MCLKLITTAKRACPVCRQIGIGLHLQIYINQMKVCKRYDNATVSN